MTYRENIKKRLSGIRGDLRENVDLSKITWLGVGGAADFLFNPADKEDITMFLQNLKTLPIILLGGCSNVLIRDGGIMGCIIRLGKNFSDIRVEGNKIYCGCGANNIAVAKAAMDNNIGGFEFLYDIPGTIGGALRMNAGCHGREMKDIVENVGVFDNGGNYFDITSNEMMFSYRASNTPPDWLFADTVLCGYPEDKEKIKETIDSYREKRKQSQPMGVKTAGCTFKNPPTTSAWKLIDTAGCRGMQVGGAVVSDKHCNFIVNVGNATASDIENLGEEIRHKVDKEHGINLEWEIRRIGVKKREK